MLRKIKSFLLLLGCFFLYIFILIFNPFHNQPKQQQLANVEQRQPLFTSTALIHRPKNIAANQVRQPFLECKLPKVDPWDPVMLPFIDPNQNINCNRTYPELTRLEDGYVHINLPTEESNEIVCEFRCLYPQTDYKFMGGPWKDVSEQPDCDVVETRCRQKDSRHFHYNYLHAQIYQRPAKWKSKQRIKMPIKVTTQKQDVDLEKKPDFGPDNGKGKRNAPDVHLFVLDSVSHTQLLRQMPKTVTWLRERMGAVSFPHLNKIGLNSIPNAFAFLFGIHVVPVEANPMGGEYKPLRDVDVMGKTLLDNEPFVGFKFRERGYRTMMAEDWARGVFNFPKYTGFEKTPVDHYMRPFQLRTRYEPPYIMGNALTKNIQEKSCKQPHHHIMRYLQDFIDAYQDQPRFSISWLTSIAHGVVNGLYRMDMDFYRFLQTNERKLNNSFFFLMADHGSRYGEIRETKPGEVEDKNPALFLVLPEHLRYNNRLAENLRENARELVTHFDIHATLVNIAKEGASMTVHSPFHLLAQQFRDPSTQFGQSLLYPLEKSVPRNCGTLKIPFEYCQCQFQIKNVTETEDKLGNQLGNAIIDKMNEELARMAENKCAHLELNPNQTVELIEIEPELSVNIFKFTLETLPGNGRFWGYVQLHDRGLPSQQHTFISTRFPRLNAHGSQSQCMKDPEIAPYCYCKNT